MTAKANVQVTVIGPIAEITFFSQPTYDDWIVVLEITAKKYASKLVMWVFCEGVSLSRDELKKGVEHAKSLFPTNLKLAFVFKHDPFSGMVHLYSVFQESSFANVMVFWSEDDARTWLLEEYEEVY